MPKRLRILFTVFEPSGDALAAPAITRILESGSNREVWAMGGPLMQAAGANLIEKTTDHAVMLAGIAGQLRIHLKRLKQLQQWLAGHPIDVLVPVDSPAANWSICKLVRRLQPDANITYLVAPQLWGWAPWRLRKLKRLTDQVLCLLPFERQWFADRGVNVQFVGHPVFEQIRCDKDPVLGLPDGQPKLALLPGSRRSEIRANWPMMLEVVRELRRQHPKLQGVVVAVDDQAAKLIKELNGTDEDDPKVMIQANQTPAILSWSDLALVVCGTASLQTAAAGKPMVIIYNVNRWLWHTMGRWLVGTRTFGLPNLIAESEGLGRIVPELVPHFGAAKPVIDQLDQLIRQPQVYSDQRQSLAQVTGIFDDHDFASTVSAQIQEVANQQASCHP